MTGILPCDRVFRLPVAFLCLLMCVARPANAQAPPKTPALPVLLEQLGRTVEVFREQFPAVACTEKISQVKLGSKGEVVQRQESQSDYLIFMKILNNDLLVEESRIQKSRAQKGNSTPLLVTNGFATLILIFHPIYQDCFQFSQVSEEMMDGRRVVHLRFQHIPGTRSTAALRIGTRDEPLALQGSAWIEPDNSAVVRITAELSAPLTERGLHTFNADVHYAPVRFASAAGAFWLPSSATIEVGTRLQHWRNTHWFTDYRRFSVSSESVIQKK
jgi:hypothetical protein